MADAYNRDASDRTSDVYDVHYCAHVSIERKPARTRQRVDAEEKRRAARQRTHVELAKAARPR